MTSKPNGSRVQRPKRHLAEARRYAFSRLAEARTEAVDALIAHARAKLRNWVLDKTAKIVAWKITRDTEVRMLRELEEDRLPLQRWLSIMNEFAGGTA